MGGEKRVLVKTVAQCFQPITRIADIGPRHALMVILGCLRVAHHIVERLPDRSLRVRTIRAINDALFHLDAYAPQASKWPSFNDELRGWLDKDEKEDDEAAE